MDNEDMIKHKGLNGTQVTTFVEKVQSEVRSLSQIANTLLLHIIHLAQSHQNKNCLRIHTK